MRVLRGLVTATGLTLLGLAGLLELLLRRRSPTTGPGPQPRAAPDPEEPAPVSAAVRRTRLVLGAVGVGVGAYGLLVLLRTVPGDEQLGILVWLAGAVVLHDAVLVPTVSLVRASAHRTGRRLPGGAVALVDGGLVVIGLLSLIALPEIWAQSRGPLNPSILPGHYGSALAITWLVVAVVTASGAAVLVARHRRELLTDKP